MQWWWLMKDVETYATWTSENYMDFSNWGNAQKCVPKRKWNKLVLDSY